MNGLGWFSVGTAVFAMLTVSAGASADDTQCRDAVYNGSRKVHQQEAKGNRKECIKDSTGNQDACINADRAKSIDQAGKLTDKFNDKCGGMGTTGVNGDINAIINAAQAATDDYHRNQWGSPVDPDGSTCHDKISKRAGDLSTAQWKGFRKCVKEAEPASGATIQACIASAIAAGTAGRGGKLIEDVAACPSPIPNLFNGDCGDDPTNGQCFVDSVECETCLALETVTDLDVDCSIISGAGCDLLPGLHKCTFDGATDNSALQICFLGVCPAPLDISGGLDIICDPATQDINGKRDCQCPLQTIDPIVISGVGTICTNPFAGLCPDGELDCDGGNALDLDIVADHTGAGTCTSNADCTALCGTYCSGIGKTLLNSGCEGFCQGGTRANLPCICDVASAGTCSGGIAGVNDCSQGSCQGKDNDIAPSYCHCNCLDESFGGPSPAGSINCRTGVALSVEAGEDGLCNGNVIANLPAGCGAFTSGTSTAIILNDNENPGNLGPYTETGAAGTCAAFDASTTTGYEMVSVSAFYDSTIGDIIARLTIDCQ